jgi:hypothetical protein
VVNRAGLGRPGTWARPPKVAKDTQQAARQGHQVPGSRADFASKERIASLGAATWGCFPRFLVCK